MNIVVSYSLKARLKSLTISPTGEDCKKNHRYKVFFISQKERIALVLLSDPLYILCKQLNTITI